MHTESLTLMNRLNTGGKMQEIACVRCRREIEPGGKSVAVYMFAQTVGVRPRQKSSANRICFCPMRRIAGDGDAA